MTLFEQHNHPTCGIPLYSSASIRLTHFAIWGNIASWFVFLIVYSKFWPTFPIAPDMVAIDTFVYGSWVFWFGLVLVPFTALIADLVYKVMSR
jgi:hypothetical protein